MMEQLTDVKEVQKKEANIEQIKLLEINLSRTNLKSLPKFHSNFQLCTTLNLSRNNLKCGIPWLASLKRLKWIDLSYNSLTELSDVCGSISTLLYLNISNNNLGKLPEWILYLDKVTELNLSHNPISIAFQAHYKIAKWNKVQICNLENTNLGSVPDCVKFAPDLRVLSVGNRWPTSSLFPTRNKLCLFPEPLPRSLHILEISNLGIVNLESNWKSLIHLKELKASTNNISWCSYDFTSLPELEVCDLSWNELTVVPQDFGLLKNLRHINLSYNKLVVLPQSFEQLKNLKHLDLYSNFLESVQCNLANMSSLVKCDLWMNVLDPNTVLGTHVDLCSRLRETLEIEERRARQNDMVPEPIASAGEDQILDLDAEESSISFCGTESSEEKEEYTECVYGEETWDEDEMFCDQSDLTSGQQPAPSVDVTDDDHYFLPAELHSPSYIRQPHLIDVVNGQFDDAD